MALAKLLEACNFIKKRLLHRCFPVNFAKFSRSLILEKICGWLLLYCAEFAKSQQQQKTKTEWRQRQNMKPSCWRMLENFFAPSYISSFLRLHVTQKKIATALFAVFSHFLAAVFKRNSNFFLPTLYQSLRRTLMTSIRIVSLDTLALMCLFMFCLLLFEMCIANDIPCALEKNDNGGIDRVCGK